MSNKKVTTKKVKVKGTETYLNQRTGEIQEMQVVSLEDRDFNFTKIWLFHIAQSLDMIGNKKIEVLNHLINNINSENQYIGTLRQISEKTNISLDTVSKTMKALKESDFLKNVNQGVYQINPNILFKGGKGKRMNVLMQYNNIDSDGVDVIEEKE